METPMSPPPPPKPVLIGPKTLRNHLTDTLSELRSKTDELVKRYQDAGIKWHLVPFSARASHHLEPEIIDMLDEVFSVDTEDGRLADTVGETFHFVVSALANAQRGLDKDKHLMAAKTWTDAASYEVMKSEEKLAVTEAAVANVIAVHHMLEGQDLLAKPEVCLDVKLACFEEWLTALSEAEKEWIEIAS